MSLNKYSISYFTILYPPPNGDGQVYKESSPQSSGSQPVVHQNILSFSYVVVLSVFLHLFKKIKLISKYPSGALCQKDWEPITAQLFKLLKVSNDKKKKIINCCKDGLVAMINRNCKRKTILGGVVLKKKTFSKKVLGVSRKKKCKLITIGRKMRIF